MPDPPDDPPDDDDRVRAELARLRDDASAPEVPEAVTARVVAALRSAPPAHTTRIRMQKAQFIAVIAGSAAAAVAVGVGAATLMRDSPAPTFPAGPTADMITVPARTLPLPDDQVLALLDRPPDFGPLSDPARRASCLTGLGYPDDVAVLGARPLDMAGRPAVLMVLAGDTPDRLDAVVVAANCSSSAAQPLARAVLPRH